MCPSLLNEFHLGKSTHPENSAVVRCLVTLLHTKYPFDTVTMLDLCLHVNVSYQNYCSEVKEVLLQKKK